MRKFIIDTDTAADDAVALLLAASEPDIEILGITTVCGNVPLKLATKNALQVIETASRKIPVYTGAEKPLVRELYTAEYVHGKDGMGDKGLVNPSTFQESKNAIDYIIDTVNTEKDIEIIALGPMTNIAKAIIKNPQAMSNVKRIWSMGTSGLGKGNVTEYAEFNVYVDAESYDIVLKSGIPITIIGLDMCLGDTSLNMKDLKQLSALSDKGRFVEKCTSKILEHNKKSFNTERADIPDAVAVAACLYSTTVKDKSAVKCECITDNSDCYGQVKFQKVKESDIELITEMDSDNFKKKLFGALK